jgi:aminoglycoside phosphotransferase (APT) family kinase protein
VAAPPGIDERSVGDWLVSHVEGVRSPLTFRLLAGGHSNLTYDVADAAGRHVVLRRPPVGEVLATAHDMVREHTIQAALGPTQVPVATMLGLCRDAAVTGAPFYVMSSVDGHVLRDQSATEPFPAAWRRRAAVDLVRTLALVHTLDPDAIGLGSLSRRDGYIARQLARWHTQWQRTEKDDLPLVDQLHAELVVRVPSQTRVSLVHGDYRFENCILDEHGAVAAVLDWELATLGEPLADLALLLIYWSRPDDPAAIFPGAPTAAEGFPERAEVLEIYARESAADVSMVDYYLAFGYWKLACISAGVLARYRAQGQPSYPGLSTQAERCAVAAAAALERG